LIPNAQKKKIIARSRRYLLPSDKHYAIIATSATTMEDDNMAISYKPLWKLLIDRNMKKKDLVAVAGISQSSVSKMGRGENINTETLNRICTALNCGVADVMEVIPDVGSLVPHSEKQL
jgi:putative transcriptional regulator